MAGQSAQSYHSASLGPDDILVPLDPITEDRILRTETASPTVDAEHIGYFDFAPKNKGLRRSSTDPNLSPGSSKHSVPSPKARAQTTYESHPESSRSAGPPKAKSSFWTQLGLSRQDTPDHTPHLHLNRRHSTHETNYSESFEASAVWDRKAVLSLGECNRTNHCISAMTSHLIFSHRWRWYPRLLRLTHSQVSHDSHRTTRRDTP